MKNLVQVLVGLITTSLLHVGCGEDPSLDEIAPETPSTASRESVPVQTQIIATGDVVDYVRATGTIFPLHDVLVTSETSGTVTEVFVELGARVRKGDAIVKIDSELKELALNQAEASLLEARSVYEKTQKDLQRNENLFASRDISEYVFEHARLQNQSAEAAFLAAQAQVKIARRYLEDTMIRSPVDGFIAGRMVGLGNSVAPGAPVAKTVDISQVKVKIGVSAVDIVKIRRGQQAHIEVDAIADARYSGTVVAVGPQAELTSRTFPVEILVENPSYVLKAGMVAKVSIATQTRSNVVLLPKSALLERAGQTLIFLAKNNKAVRRLPKMGTESGDFIVLEEGAKEGDEVVVLGQENLSDGQSLEVKARQ